jgi:hypothetical protein
MAEYGELDDQILDVKEFKLGDFVKWLLYDVKPSFAVVTEVKGENIYISHLEDGTPFELSKTPKYGGIAKASREEALNYFHSISNAFERKMNNGGLAEAISANEQHYLDGIIANLEADGANPYEAIRAPVKAPETGLYVLMGIYSGQGPSEHLEGLVAVPRISEKEVSKIMFGLKPDGFGNIPSDVYNTPATSHGDLVAYWSYEVPEKARVMVLNPSRLEHVNSEWRFSERAAKR